MEIQRLFAVVCVSDIEKSVTFYSGLIGRTPDDRPMDDLVQWRDNSGAGVQLVLDIKKAGASLITIVTPDMDLVRKEITAAKLELEPDIQGDFGIIAQINDPDGNRITLAEPPNM